MSSIRDLKDALWASHRRLVAAAASIPPDQLVSPSYCIDWTIAQVLSHIGSGAEIFGLLLDAALAGSDPPDRTAFSTIWDAWNAMTPQEQGRTSIRADAAFLERVDSINDDRLETLRMMLFRHPGDAARLLGMRLSEHAIHTWDVVVMGDPPRPSLRTRSTSSSMRSIRSRRARARRSRGHSRWRSRPPIRFGSSGCRCQTP